jgi:hypothetical protein
MGAVGGLILGWVFRFEALRAVILNKAKPCCCRRLSAVFPRGYRSVFREIIVETANRFVRNRIVEETGFKMLRDLGIELIATDSPTRISRPSTWQPALPSQSAPRTQYLPAQLGGCAVVDGWTIGLAPSAERAADCCAAEIGRMARPLPRAT